MKPLDLVLGGLAILGLNAIVTVVIVNHRVGAIAPPQFVVLDTKSVTAGLDLANYEDQLMAQGRMAKIDATADRLSEQGYIVFNGDGVLRYPPELRVQIEAKPAAPSAPAPASEETP